MKARYKRAESQRPELAKPFIQDNELMQGWASEMDMDQPTVLAQWRDQWREYTADDREEK